MDRTGIEPVTPTMSMWCSTAEPTILRWANYTTVIWLYNIELAIKQRTSERNHPQSVQYHLLRNTFRFESRQKLVPRFRCCQCDEADPSEQ